MVILITALLKNPLNARHHVASSGRRVAPTMAPHNGLPPNDSGVVVDGNFASFALAICLETLDRIFKLYTPCLGKQDAMLSQR